MRKQNGFLFLAVVCIAALLASCGKESGSVNPAQSQGPTQEPSVVKGIDKGNLIRKEGNRWLITAYVEKNGAPSMDAYWFTMNEQTVLQNSGGQNVLPDNISIGAQVEAWHTGAVKESFPAQAAAAKIIVNPDKQEVPEDMIGQTAAIKAALQSQTGSTAAWAVKKASLDTDKGYWNVELVKIESMNQPVTIRINASSGQTVPIPVAENKSFRVFTPVPGTEADPTFTVEGEARVFEAAFSWRLEDGHNVLAEGHEMANGGAPAWGRFRFNVSYKKASQPNITLILFVYSAKDGSIEDELIVPLKVPKSPIKY